MLGKKLLIIIGTRPEAIKVAPILLALRGRKDYESLLVLTGQHRELIDPVLKFFDLIPDYDFNLIEERLTPNEFAGECLKQMERLLEREGPTTVLVHGDTLTSTICAFAAFQRGVRVAHLEAGLRTYNKSAPFPEEVNRQITARIADIHFAPTSSAKVNLLSEHIDSKDIFVVGNSVLDALRMAIEILPRYESDQLQDLKSRVDFSKKLLLVTGHRRENFGEGLTQICEALRRLAARGDLQIICPVHLNPNVKELVEAELKDIPNIILIEPLGYPEFIWIMKESHLILSDSGGVQEEASFLGKPLLIAREVTERPEVIANGAAILVGTNANRIIGAIDGLMKDHGKDSSMSKAGCPFGDGMTASRVLEVL